jgi:hypothetical protein
MKHRLAYIVWVVLVMIYCPLVILDIRVGTDSDKGTSGFVNNQLILPVASVYDDTLIVMDAEMLNRLMPLARNSRDSFNFYSITCYIK